MNLAICEQKTTFCDSVNSYAQIAQTSKYELGWNQYIASSVQTLNTSNEHASINRAPRCRASLMKIIKPVRTRSVKSVVMATWDAAAAAVTTMTVGTPTDRRRRARKSEMPGLSVSQSSDAPSSVRSGDNVRRRYNRLGWIRCCLSGADCRASWLASFLASASVDARPACLWLTSALASYHQPALLSFDSGCMACHCLSVTDFASHWHAMQCRNYSVYTKSGFVQRQITCKRIATYRSNFLRD